MSYLMESPEETQRLLAQERQEDAASRWLAAGLRPGHRVLDAGCGPGLLTRKMAELVGPSGTVHGVDISLERLREAERQTADLGNVLFRQADVYRLPFGGESFDFVHAQFLFQYLRDPDAALAELKRVTVRGGTVMVTEIDGSGLIACPCPGEVEEGLRLLVPALERVGFDFFSGRKMFSRFKSAGFGSVDVRVFPHYVFAGAANFQTLSDWRTRFDALAPVGAVAFGSQQRYEAFCMRYLALLQAEDSLKYAVLLATEGIRL